MSNSVRLHRRQPTRLPRPWDSPGKNTGVGCHFLLQCMKVKSESEVAQLYRTLSNPMDCSLPGSSIHGIFQARVLEWGAVAFSDATIIHSYLHKVFWCNVGIYDNGNAVCVCAQSCLTLCDPMDSGSWPGSCVHGIFQARILGVGCHFLLQGIFPTQGSNLCLLCLLHCQADSLPMSHLGSP